jgi:ABC-type sugar transport system, periplasmic component
MKLKILCALLLLCILTSCAADSDTDPITSDNPVSEESVETSEEIIEPTFPEANYDGFEFRILARDNDWDKMEVDFDEPQAEVIYNAVYERNMAAETLYNVKVTGIKTTADIYNMVKSSHAAGANDYDIVLTSMADSARLAREGYLRSFTKIEGIDINNSWWDQNIYNDLSINGNIYFMTGDINIRDNDNTWLLLFNKKLIESFSLDSPYDAVKNGGWTFDKMYEMGKDVGSDLNGDGVYDSEDRYGLITTGEGGKNFFYSAGLKVLDKNSQGEFELVLAGDRSQSVINKINSIFNEDNFTYYKVASWQQAEEMFAADKSLFYGEIATHVINLRYMETDFGIIPTPKFDENQIEYYTHVASNGTAVTIPDVLPDEERTGNITEALGYYGQKYLTPAFNEVSLESKFSRDVESSDMLDIIWKSVRYDIGYLFNIGSMSDITTTLISQNKPENFQSTYEKNLSKAESDLEQLIEAYNSIQG